MREYLKAWRIANPEKDKANRKRYNQSASAKARDARRRAREREAEGDHTAAEVLEMLRDQGEVCAYCEQPLNGAYAVEHMTPLARGGRNDWPNLAVTCRLCNLRKGTKTITEYFSVPIGDR